MIGQHPPENMLGRGLVIVEVRLRPNEQELFARHHADAVGHELFAVARAEMTLVRVASLELHRTVVTVEWRFSSVTSLVLLETVSKDKQKILLVLLLLPHLFNDLFSRTTWVNRYQKGKTSLDLYEAREDGDLGCSGISSTKCKQTGNHANTPSLNFFRSDARTTPNQQCQSTEGNKSDEGKQEIHTNK